MQIEIGIDCLGFLYSTHAVKRMLEKDITTFEIEQTVLFGEVIHFYDDDKPFPSKLLLKFVANRPIHIVVAQNIETKECIIITCYEPDITIWNGDFKTKK
jgi:hypothetical protein